MPSEQKIAVRRCVCACHQLRKQVDYAAVVEERLVLSFWHRLSYFLEKRPEPDFINKATWQRHETKQERDQLTRRTHTAHRTKSR